MKLALKFIIAIILFGAVLYLNTGVDSILAQGPWPQPGVIGTVTEPPHLKAYGGNIKNKGLVSLISNIVKLIIVVGGLIAFINLILAGISYIIYGDKPEELTKAHQRIYMSLIGLVIMVSSFVLAGLVGWLVFDDATFILNPKIYGPIP